MKKEIIAKIAEEIMTDFGEWAGPDGLCWCEDQQKYVDPETTDCPTCRAQNANEMKTFRYIDFRRSM